MNTKLLAACCLSGLCVYLGLGLIGFGENTVAEIMRSAGVGSPVDEQLSRLVFGLTIVVTVLLFVFGLDEERYGIDPS